MLNYLQKYDYNTSNYSVDICLQYEIQKVKKLSRNASLILKMTKKNIMFAGKWQKLFNPHLLMFSMPKCISFLIFDIPFFFVENDYVLLPFQFEYFLSDLICKSKSLSLKNKYAFKNYFPEIHDFLFFQKISSISVKSNFFYNCFRAFNWLYCKI